MFYTYESLEDLGTQLLGLVTSEGWLFCQDSAETLSFRPRDHMPLRVQIQGISTHPLGIEYQRA